MVKLPEVWRALATKTLIDILIYKCLYTVLYDRLSGLLLHNDEGHFIPTLGASGPKASLGPNFPPPAPTPSGLPLPQLPISPVYKRYVRPPQAYIPAARLRQGPGHQYSAAWNARAS